MDSHLFKSLKECDAKNCWSLVRDIVTIQLIGDGVTPIPFLEEAVHYDMGAVILKEERDIKQKLQMIKPSAISVGMLTQYIKQENVEGTIQGATKSNKVNTNLNPDFVFEESDMKNKDKKSVRVELKGCEKFLMEKVPTEGSLILDIVEKGFENLKKIHLIYEVYYVDEVKIAVNINQESSTYESKSHMPIGFRMVQYKLKPSNELGTTKYIDNSKWKVYWLSKKKIRLPMDRLPPVPGESGTGTKKEEKDGPTEK